MADADFMQMQAALGSLLLLWSAIEKEALSAIKGSESDSKEKGLQGAGSLLKAWRNLVAGTTGDGALRSGLAQALCTRLRHPLDVRNGVCHGLVAISASGPSGPACLTWQTEAETCQITWGDLQAIFRFLSKVPNAMSIIAGQSERLADTPKNRDWWASEYGLILNA